MFHELNFGFLLGIEFLEVLDELLCDRNECFFWPWEEPIDGALIEERGELA
jgi:hypothetical protein